MIAIVEGGEPTILATGTHAELSKKIFKQRRRNKWQFPIRLISDTATLTSDEDYINRIKAVPAHSSERRQARFILNEMQDGIFDPSIIARRLGLSVSLVKDLIHKYHLTKQIWKAQVGAQIIQADSAAELNLLLKTSAPESSVAKVKDAAMRGKRIGPYRIYQSFDLKAKV